MREELELEVYDAIGADWFGEGVTAKGIKAALDKAGDVRRITVRINSPGGDVFDAVAIYNLLRQHKAPVRVFIDGLAASAASVVAMAGDEIIVGEGAFLMIHNSSGIVLGPAADMRQMADLLDKIDGQIAGFYAARADKDAEEMRRMMDDETWLTGGEAMAAGLADRMADEGERRAVKPMPRDEGRKAFAYKRMPAAARKFFDFEKRGEDPPADKPEEEESEMAEEQNQEASAEQTAEIEQEETQPEALTPEKVQAISDEASEKAIKAERERVNAIRAKGAEYGLVEMAAKLEAEGKPAAEAIDALKDEAIKRFRAAGAPKVGPDADSTRTKRADESADEAARNAMASNPKLTYREALLAVAK